MARFDLYEGRKSWWWYCYLTLASAKGTYAYPLVREMIFDAIEYEDKYNRDRKKEGVLNKYNGKNGTFKA